MMPQFFKIGRGILKIWLRFLTPIFGFLDSLITDKRPIFRFLGGKKMRRNWL